MKPKRAEYRNAIRSRNLIKEAFVEILNEKPIDKITVTDIVRRADINRGTFYAHYVDTKDVLEQIQNEIIEKILQFIGEFKYESLIKDTNLILSKLTKYFEQDLNFYRKLVSGYGSEEFLNQIKVIFIDAIYHNKEIPIEIKNKKAFEVQINFFAGGIISLYEDWFNGKINGTLTDLNKEIMVLIKFMYEFFT